MKLLLVEDDDLQLPRIEELLGEYFPAATFQSASTESEFRELMPSLSVDPPGLVICDVRLRWTRPPDQDNPPTECRDPTEAGLRCWRLLRASSGTASTPVVLFTIQMKEDLGNTLALDAKTRLVTKCGDNSGLEAAIRALVPGELSGG